MFYIYEYTSITSFKVIELSSFTAAFPTFFLVLIATLETCIATSYNVVDFGAKADGKTDSSSAFLKTWTAACQSGKQATVIVPHGTFLVNSVSFNGSCKNEMQLKMSGNIVAPDSYKDRDHQAWISFYRVTGLSIFGGTIDGKGSSYWSCKLKRQDCPPPARSFSFQSCKDVIVSGLKSFNSQAVHVFINQCNNITMHNLTLTAPRDSPNTDGIHIGNSMLIKVLDSTISTGDDCISIGPGTRNMTMERIVCGPGHGISIGSLGGNPVEDGVEHIRVTDSIFTNTDNGVRIKTWAKPSNCFANDIVFKNLIMTNVANTIIIDQEYCPEKNCPKASSGTKISNVEYNNVTGTSRTEEAITLRCSSKKPCERIKLQNINLAYLNNMKRLPATAHCQDAQVVKAGVVIPSC